MKIAVVGCGALGGFYGAKLQAAGEEVHFLLRSDFDAVRREGVRIHSVDGDFQARPLCARHPREIGRTDLVVVGLKTTANESFADLITPLVRAGTAILTLQNGLGNEAQLAGIFGAGNILGGLCFVCLNRSAPGVIHHSAHGRILMGEYQRPVTARCLEIRDLFRRAGVPCDATDNLERAHWEKLVWNIPFNGLGVASAAGLPALVTGELRIPPDPGNCRTTDQLLSDPAWEEWVRYLMSEVITTANALGLEIGAEAMDENIRRTREMGAYKASTLIDYQRGQALELESLFLRPLRAARQAGVATPRLAALCRLLERMDQAGSR